MAATRTLVISSDPVGCGHRVYFHCYVYKTFAELQTAAMKYDTHGSPAGYWDGAAACFQPRLSFGSDAAGATVRGPYTAFLGVMRLAEEMCDMDIVIHECTHAAVNYVNVLRLRSGYMLGRSNIANEEALCFAVQHFSTAVGKALGYLDNRV